MNKLLDAITLRKGNQAIVMVYITLLAVVVGFYFILVALPASGYHQEAFEQAYMFFMLLSLWLFSTLLPFWNTGISSFSGWLNNLAGILILTISTIPHILLILLLGKLKTVDFLLLMTIQAVWGMALLSLKHLLKAFLVTERRRALILAVFIFIILFLTPLFLYYFVVHEQVVVTAVFDQGIPPFFFINPLLAMAGVLELQTGGQIQGGYTPYPVCLAFWLIFSTISILAAEWADRRRKGRGVNNGEKEPEKATGPGFSNG